MGKKTWVKGLITIEICSCNPNPTDATPDSLHFLHNFTIFLSHHFLFISAFFAQFCARNCVKNTLNSLICCLGAGGWTAVRYTTAAVTKDHNGGTAGWNGSWSARCSRTSKKLRIFCSQRNMKFIKPKIHKNPVFYIYPCTKNFNVIGPLHTQLSCMIMAELFIHSRIVF